MTLTDFRHNHQARTAIFDKLQHENSFVAYLAIDGYMQDYCKDKNYIDGRCGMRIPYILPVPAKTSSSVRAM